MAVTVYSVFRYCRCSTPVAECSCGSCKTKCHTWSGCCYSGLCHVRFCRSILRKASEAHCTVHLFTKYSARHDWHCLRPVYGILQWRRAGRLLLPDNELVELEMCQYSAVVHLFISSNGDYSVLVYSVINYSQLQAWALHQQQMMLGTTNLAPGPIAGCCHLATLMAWYQSHCQSILKVSQAHDDCCNSLKLSETL